MNKEIEIKSKKRKISKKDYNYNNRRIKIVGEVKRENRKRRNVQRRRKYVIKRMKKKKEEI